MIEVYLGIFILPLSSLTAGKGHSAICHVGLCGKGIYCPQMRNIPAELSGSVWVNLCDAQVVTTCPRQSYHRVLTQNAEAICIFIHLVLCSTHLVRGLVREWEAIYWVPSNTPM